MIAFLFAAVLALAAPSVPDDAQGVIAKMIAVNPSLQNYKARVHVNVHMTSFPWLSPQLDGTSYYKRPDKYEVVFDRVPGYAKGFSKLFNDIGDPGAWQKDQNITLDGFQTLNGRAVIVLRLTKKIHSDILDHTLAYVDPATYELLQMEWYYTSGGKITMTQKYRTQGSYTVLASQHADIHIPHVSAVADSTFGTYDTNVAAAEIPVDQKP